MPRTPEQLFWDKVRPLLAGLDPVRIENSVGLGIPDVNCTLGWIELKQVREQDIPKKANTILHLRHYTPEQRVFQLRRNRARGGCWLLLLLGKEWCLFNSYEAVRTVGKFPVEATRLAACYRWDHTPAAHDLQAALRDTMLCTRVDR